MFGKSPPHNTPKQPDSFDEMFEFEATIRDRLTPYQLDEIEREEMVKKFGAGKAWLSQPEQRAEFQLLDARHQLSATFADVRGYKGSELEALVNHLRGDWDLAVRREREEKGR